MRATQSGWKPRDFQRLYEGFGFQKEEGGNHTRYQHCKYRHLIATVGRHPRLTPGYANDAVELIDCLKQLQAKEGPGNGNS